jgi:Spy/CpxP family protein refolding chaperone
MNPKFFPAAALCASLAVVTLNPFGAAARAQDNTEPPAVSPVPAAESVDQGRLEQFVDALIAVQSIQDDYRNRLTPAMDESSTRELEAAAREEMMQAVTQTGLEIDEFNQIAIAMQTDQDLRARVEQRVRERLGS